MSALSTRLSPAIFAPFFKPPRTRPAMIVGVPKEIKTREYRVGLVPGGAAALVQRGHAVLIEKGAGLGSGIPDEAYVRAGAQIVDKAAAVWGRAELIIQVQ